MVTALAPGEQSVGRQQSIGRQQSVRRQQFVERQSTGFFAKPRRGVGGQPSALALGNGRIIQLSPGGATAGGGTSVPTKPVDHMCVARIPTRSGLKPLTLPPSRRDCRNENRCVRFPALKRWAGRRHPSGAVGVATGSVWISSGRLRERSLGHHGTTFGFVVDSNDLRTRVSQRRTSHVALRTVAIPHRTVAIPP